MTTAGTIVTAGFREGNLVPVGSSPTDNETSEGLDILNRLVLSAFGFTIGNRLVDWQIPAVQRTGNVSRDYPLLPGATFHYKPFNTSPPPNSRIVWDGSAQHVYFVPDAQDGAVMAAVKGSGAAGAVQGELTLDGNGRTIAGQPTLVIDGSTLPTQWFYRADYADWREVKPIALADDMLFPREMDDLWICALSIRMAPRYGKTVAASTTARFGEMSAIFKARYQQTAPTTGGGEDLFGTFQSFPNVGPGMRWMS